MVKEQSRQLTNEGHILRIKKMGGGGGGEGRMKRTRREKRRRRRRWRIRRGEEE